jgi:uncharacterized membrane protein YesL
MSDAFRVTWQSLKDLWEEFVFIIVLNILWILAVAVVLAPLYLLGSTNPILALVLTFVLFGLLPIVSGALCFVTNQISRGMAVGWGTFVTGLSRYWLKSLAVALINLVVLALTVTNFQFYAVVLQGAWTNFALSVWVVVAIYWLIAQIYWFPMLLELESEKVLEALRNALVLVIISPGFSLTMAFILLILAALCIALTVPIPLFMAALLLLIINHATRSRLAHVQRRRASYDNEG